MLGLAHLSFWKINLIGLHFSGGVRFMSFTKHFHPWDSRCVGSILATYQ